MTSDARAPVDREEVARRLRALMRHEGCDPGERKTTAFAKRAGVDPSTIWYLLNAQRGLGEDTIAAFREKLGLSADFWYESDPGRLRAIAPWLEAELAVGGDASASQQRMAAIEAPIAMGTRVDGARVDGHGPHGQRTTPMHGVPSNSNPVRRKPSAFNDNVANILELARERGAPEQVIIGLVQLASEASIEEGTDSHWWFRRYLDLLDQAQKRRAK